MRNKIFAIVFSCIFFAMFVGAPLTLALTKAGIIEYNNVGNEILPDKSYSEDTLLFEFFDGFEKMKVKIKDTYINNLPGFLKITNFFKPAKDSLNQPLIDFFQKKGNEMSVFVCHHVYEENSVLSTCDKGGYTERICRLCGESILLEEIEPLGHDFKVLETVAPTCIKTGFVRLCCTRCSHEEITDVVKEKGHDFTYLETVPSTCESEGEEVSVCLVCGIRASKILPLSEHNYKDNKCTICGVLQNLPSDHICHIYETETIPPTCDNGGYTISRCTECGLQQKSVATLPLGHKIISKIVSPTCESEGYTEEICERCGEKTITDKTSKLTHNYTVETVPPTTEENGYDIYTCTICSSSYKDNFTEAVKVVIPDPIITSDPEGTTYTTSLKTVDRMFRHYEISAKFPSGEVRSTYARIVKLDRELMYESMLEVVDLVNAMVKKDESVNWYFAFATNIEATEFGESILPQESTRYIYESFLSLVDKSVQVSAVEVTSFSDYYNKFFITDHHWNHEGSEEAYNSIVRMLRENYPDIEPIPVEEKYEFTDVKFYGSLARANANYKTSDIFGVYFRELPRHSVKLDSKISYGSENTNKTNLQQYIKGTFSTAEGFNHYTEFYRVCKEVNCPDNETGRNLLIIGDSYSLPLLEVVSCHFDNAYIRYEDRSFSKLPEDLYYDEFIKEKNITDVIVIEEMAKSIMKGYGTSYPSGFLNIYPDKNY